jgi:hypothetical protein
LVAAGLLQQQGHALHLALILQSPDRLLQKVRLEQELIQLNLMAAAAAAGGVILAIRLNQTEVTEGLVAVVLFCIPPIQMVLVEMVIHP